MRPLLVGEDNPYSADPRHALSPYPERSAGFRLATVILGMNRAQYLRTFDRVNLCAHGKWSGRIASKTADRLLQDDREHVVLLGRKVAAAFGCGDHPAFSTRPLVCGTMLYLLPHPSGLSRAWNEPGAIERARELLAPLLIEPVLPRCASCSSPGPDAPCTCPP